MMNMTMMMMMMTMMMLIMMTTDGWPYLGLSSGGVHELTGPICRAAFHHCFDTLQHPLNIRETSAAPHKSTVAPKA